MSDPHRGVEYCSFWQILFQMSGKRLVEAAAVARAGASRRSPIVGRRRTCITADRRNLNLRLATGPHKDLPQKGDAKTIDLPSCGQCRGHSETRKRVK
jgi:hypothetical protein